MVYKEYFSIRINMKKIITTLTLFISLNISAMAEEISTYLIGSSFSMQQTKAKLKASGFDILATNNNVITITNEKLQASNTYLATLQVYVNDLNIKVQNPEYFAAAYLGEKYKKGQFETTIQALNTALGTLKGSREKLDEKELPEYHFMMGMPYFDDFITVGEGTKIYEKIAKNEDVLYSLTLPNGTILVGHKLKPTTTNFLKTLKQRKNSQILPYEAIVFSDEVQIMNPKFYLALSLPQLSMGEFMKISDIPSRIEEDIINAYK